MPPEPSILSLPLRLDLAHECLWRGAEDVLSAWDIAPAEGSMMCSQE
jgi:hypothetical protein